MLILDTPVSENGSTGMALGAALTGSKAVVVHPRMDFMILATDQIVNQAAKWRFMMGGKASTNLTIRSIITMLKIIIQMLIIQYLQIMNGIFKYGLLC